jgi:hypothetical protein
MRRHRLARLEQHVRSSLHHALAVTEVGMKCADIVRGEENDHGARGRKSVPHRVSAVGRGAPRFRDEFLPVERLQA